MRAVLTRAWWRLVCALKGHPSTARLYEVWSLDPLRGPIRIVTLSCPRCGAVTATLSGMGPSE